MPGFGGAKNNTRTAQLEVLMNAFPGMNVEEASFMINCGDLLDIAPHTVLCHEGANEDVFYVILDGKFEVTKLFDNDEARILQQLGMGEFFGEMAIIHHAPRAATVTAAKPSRVLAIPQGAFERLLESSSSISMAMVREVSRRLRENDTIAIEELRQKTHELTQAYQLLEEQEKARQSFLATVAHELRTPLTSAVGFTQLIHNANFTGPDLLSAVATVQRSLEEIIALSNDILFLEEVDLILPNFEPTDVTAVVYSSLEGLHAHAERAEIEIEVEADPDLPKISAAPRVLQRAIDAIVANAIKFSPGGSKVSISIRSVEPGIAIAVKDKGLGLPEDVLPHIFERFFRYEPPGHNFRGIGVGLSIAQEVLRRHNGHIEVQSQPGRGSIFTIYLKTTSA